MAERDDLLASIASTIKDYRAGEIPQRSPAHVDRWIRQFSEDVQMPMLRELDYVFKKTYIPRPRVEQLLLSLTNHTSLVGNNAHDYWSKAYILNIQRKGQSQAELRMLFGGILKEIFNLNIDDCGIHGGSLIYLDDAIFTGDRVIDDIESIMNDIPDGIQLHIITIAVHSYARYWFSQNNRIQPTLSRKRIQVQFWEEIHFENRRSWNSQSGGLIPTDVLRPDEIDARNHNQRESRFFSGVEGRQLLEREFLRAGNEIRGFALNPDAMLKPLGYSRFEPGFGSLFVTYRNCPNNCPLALWYGDPSTYGPNHPLGRWYPLFPRKPHSQ